jgi:hypothetical protein
MMQFITKSIVAASLAAGLATAASAVTITPVSATASSAFSGYGANFAIDGLANTDWASNSEGVGSTIYFDLGGLWDITSTSVTDRVTSGSANGTFAYGVSDFSTGYTVEFYSDVAGTNLVGSFAYFTLPVPVSPTSPADFRIITPISFNGIRSVRYVVDGTNGGVNPGISEISFEGTRAQGVVPEAATWAMLIAGFGLVGAAARRRRIVVSA